MLASGHVHVIEEETTDLVLDLVSGTFAGFFFFAMVRFAREYLCVFAQLRGVCNYMYLFNISAEPHIENLKVIPIALGHVVFGGPLHMRRHDTVHVEAS